MSSSSPFMIYGATGYTGGLIVEEAVKKGLKPVVAGRNHEKVAAIASKYDLPSAVFSVDDQSRTEMALSGIKAVLSVAGPFAHTAEKLTGACIMQRVHYLDVTGEIDVFELCAGRHAEAGAAGITLMPGVGFDVVPSDCLAASVTKLVDDPVSIELAINAGGNPSRGTAKTMVESLGQGLKIRRGGKIVTQFAPLKKQFDLGDGLSDFIAVSWGDVSTAYHSTGVGDVTVYFPAVGPVKAMTAISRFAGPILRSKGLQNYLKKKIDQGSAGPSDDVRAAAGADLFCRVTDKGGKSATGILKTPNGYTLTAEAAVEATLSVLENAPEAGFSTPSKAFGADFVTTLSGCEMTLEKAG